MTQLVAHLPADPEIRVQGPARDIIYSDYKGILLLVWQICMNSIELRVVWAGCRCFVQRFPPGYATN